MSQMFHVQKVCLSHSAIRALAINSEYLFTGGDECILRAWSLSGSFEEPTLEVRLCASALFVICQSFSIQAEHEGTILALNTSLDGYRIGVSTSRGNLGVLDLLSKSYQTLTRSHTQVLYNQRILITLE